MRASFKVVKAGVGGGLVARLFITGVLPVTIDDSLRVDVTWLRRLTGSREGARELVEQLMFEGILPADLDMLSSTFSMERFFRHEFFPVSLYYLGLVTFRGDYCLGFPNLSVKKIFTEHFNELEGITFSSGYQAMFERFLHDHDWAALFAGYWENYVGQIPRQAFDKANENFFRTRFYELCTRYLGRFFHLAIEVNSHAGRSGRLVAAGQRTVDHAGWLSL